jgi:hypothetical protein
MQKEMLRGIHMGIRKIPAALRIHVEAKCNITT